MDSLPTIHPAGCQRGTGHYCNLVIEGGGVLGVAYATAFEELDRRGILKNIINYAATSAGTIAGGVLYCGASTKYIREKLVGINFKKFIDYGYKVKAVYNALKYNGLCPGDYFCEWYGEIIGELTGNRNITLKEAHDLFGGRMVFTVVNITKRGIVEYLDWENNPDLSFVLAARMSMSIPGIFIPVLYNGCLYVDGGLLDNYPIGVFHYDGADSDRINPHTIGLMLITNAETKTDNFPPIDGLWDFANVLISILMNKPQKIHLDKQDWDRTIKIPCGNILSMDFGIKPHEVDQLLDAGGKAVSDYFDGKSYKPQHQQHSRCQKPDDEVSQGYTPPDRTINSPTSLISLDRTFPLPPVKPVKRYKNGDCYDVIGELEMGTKSQKDRSQDRNVAQPLKKKHPSLAELSIARSPPIDIVLPKGSRSNFRME